jgi:hypothetical protein
MGKIYQTLIAGIRCNVIGSPGAYKVVIAAGQGLERRTIVEGATTEQDAIELADHKLQNNPAQATGIHSK